MHAEYVLAEGTALCYIVIAQKVPSPTPSPQRGEGYQTGSPLPQMGERMQVRGGASCGFSRAWARRKRMRHSRETCPRML